MASLAVATDRTVEEATTATVTLVVALEAMVRLAEAEATASPVEEAD